MRFLHTGDLHLGRVFSEARYGRAFAQQRRRELLDTFSRIIDYANEHQVDLILCCGDFLNSDQLCVEELRNINAMIERLKRAVVFAISGNHDPQIENSAYQKISWSRRLYLAPPGISRMMLEPLGASITCHSWDKKEMTEPFSVPKADAHSNLYQILMLHADALSEESRYLPVDKDALIQVGFDYVALGHIHAPIELAPNVRYAGSPEPLDFGEEGSHGFWLVDTDAANQQVQFVPFARRNYRTLTVQTAAQDAELAIAERIAAKLPCQDDIYTVGLYGTHPSCAGWDLSRIREELLGQGYLCRLDDQTTPDYDLEQLGRENQGNLIGDFIASFQGETMDAVHRRALEYGLEALISQKGRES